MIHSVHLAAPSSVFPSFHPKACDPNPLQLPDFLAVTHRLPPMTHLLNSRCCLIPGGNLCVKYQDVLVAATYYWMCAVAVGIEHRLLVGRRMMQSDLKGTKKNKVSVDFQDFQ